MPVFDDVDAGRATLSVGPDSGAIGGSTTLYGDREAQWVSGRRAWTREQVVDVYAPSAVGANAARSKAAARAIVSQLKEMVGSVRYVQWSSGDGVTVSDENDGWWRLDAVEPQTLNWSMHVPTRIRATLVALAGEPYAVGRIGSSPLSTPGFSGAAQELVGFPLNTQATVPTSITRVGGEGNILCAINPPPASSPFNPPAALSDLFRGRVRIFDSMAVGGNAIPTGAPGSWLNANWQEAYGPDHAFIGDAVITNGLVALVATKGQSRLLQTYVWVAGSGWAQGPDVVYGDNAGNVGSLAHLRVVSAGWNSVRIKLRAVTSAGNWGEFVFRLRRGGYHVIFTFKPVTQANTIATGVRLVYPAAPKIAFNSGYVSDTNLGAASGSVPTDYGYAAAFATGAGLVAGFLYASAPAQMPNLPGSGAATVGLGDTSGPAIGTFRTYGIFLAPATTANLQAEAESGTLANGCVSAADAAASAGNAAKIPSGSVASAGTAYSVFGTSWQPPAGTYRAWFRVRSGTAGAGTNNEVNLVIRDTTIAVGGGGYAVSTRSLRPVDVSTSYAWFYSGASPFAVPAGHNIRFEVDSVNDFNASVDWYVDQAVLLPVALTAANGPQDIWQQFKADYEYELSRAA